MCMVPDKNVSEGIQWERKIMRKNSIKNTRINMEVQRELSDIIRTQVKDPRLKNAMVTVVDAEVSPDLKYCKAYISVLGSQDSQKSVLEGLKSAVGFIRKELARRVNLRNTPEITFVADNSIAYGVNMVRMIDDVTKDLRDDEFEDDVYDEDDMDDEDEIEDEDDIYDEGDENE